MHASFCELFWILAQSLKRDEVQLVLLAKDCDEGNYWLPLISLRPSILDRLCSAANYGAVLKSYCAMKGVYLLRNLDMAQLGEYSGLYDEDADGNPVKIRPTGAVAIKTFGDEVRPLRAMHPRLPGHPTHRDVTTSTIAVTSSSTPAPAPAIRGHAPAAGAAAGARAARAGRALCTCHCTFARAPRAARAVRCVSGEQIPPPCPPRARSRSDPCRAAGRRRRRRRRRRGSRRACSICSSTRRSTRRSTSPRTSARPRRRLPRHPPRRAPPHAAPRNTAPAPPERRRAPCRRTSSTKP
jgi:hypothetical protein